MIACGTSSSQQGPAKDQFSMNTKLHIWSTCCALSVHCQLHFDSCSSVCDSPGVTVCHKYCCAVTTWPDDS